MGIHSAAWARNVTWDAGADPISESVYFSIALKIFPEFWDMEEFIYNLKARHFLYSHTEQGMPHFHNGIMIQQSDCGGGGAVSGGAKLQTLGDISKGSKLAGVGLAVGHTVGIGTAAGVGAGGIGAAGTTIATIASVAGWATLGIGLVVAPLAFIAAHHAKAVALEQHDICGATVSGNAMLDDIDAQFYADAITESQAVQGLQNLRNGLAQAMAVVTTATGRTKKTCNAACVYLYFFDGLVELRKNHLYPMHTAGLAAKILPPVASQAISSAGSSVSGFVSGLTGGSVKLSSNAGFLLLLLAIGIMAMAASKKGAVHA